MNGQLERLGSREQVAAIAGRPDADAEQAAWVAIARVLLNLDEFIMKE